MQLRACKFTYITWVASSVTGDVFQSCEKRCGSTKRDRGCSTKGIERHATFALASELYVRQENCSWCSRAKSRILKDMEGNSREVTEQENNQMK